MQFQTFKSKLKMIDTINNGKAFDFQLEILKYELETINKCIDKIDILTHSFKNWTILLWGGSIILALGKDATDFKGKFILTAITPLLFWLLDAWWRRIQREFIFRNNETFEEKKIIGLVIYDLRSSKTSNKKSYKNFTSIKRALLFRSVGLFYFGLILISIGLYVYMTFYC
ncbi:hypothetical protein D3C85_756010 [compost metagenome]